MAYEGQRAAASKRDAWGSNGGSARPRISVGLIAAVALAAAAFIGAANPARHAPDGEDATRAPMLLELHALAGTPASSTSMGPTAIGSAWSMPPFPEPPTYLSSATDLPPLTRSSSASYSSP